MAGMNNMAFMYAYTAFKAARAHGQWAFKECTCSWAVRLHPCYFPGCFNGDGGGLVMLQLKILGLLVWFSSQWSLQWPRKPYCDCG